jgi:arginine-tRNA-protein transferase
MEIVLRWTEATRRCHYLPDHRCQIEYVCVAKLDPDEYMAHLLAGWRRFGHTLFRQTCTGRDACRSLRADAANFLPDRSQRRTRQANEGTVELRIGTPSTTPEKVALLNRFHADRSETRGWLPSDLGDPTEYARAFVLNPFPTQEWCFSIDDVLVGVGYVDELPGGLSAIYFARDPAFRERSLGTWNVLCLLDRAKALGLPHVYLGYHAHGSASLQYKGRFRPHQRLGRDGVWRDDGT